MSNADEEFKDVRSTGLQKNPEPVPPVSSPIFLEYHKWKPIPISVLNVKTKDELIEIVIELNKRHNNLIRDIQNLMNIVA